MALENWLADAWADYEGSWASVDAELYELCIRRGHDRFEDVYTKVTVINRVYMAGISRSVERRSGVDPETRVTKAFLKNGELVRECLSGVQPAGPPARELMAEIVNVHGRITTSLKLDVGRRLPSFVSKYLHFHRACFPIFDDLAWRGIGKVTKENAHALSGVEIRREDVADADPYYFSYCRRFLALYELAQGRGVDVCAKMLDHALWSMGRSPTTTSAQSQIDGEQGEMKSTAPAWED